MTDLRARAEALIKTASRIGSMRTVVTEHGSFDDGPGRCALWAVPHDDPEAEYIVSDDCEDGAGSDVAAVINDAPAIIRDLLAALPPDPAPTGERTDDAWPLLVAVERAREAIDAEEERRKVPTWSMLRTTLAEAEASLRVYTRRRMRDDAKVAPRG